MTQADKNGMRTVLVEEAGTGRFVQTIEAGPHHLVGDEPEAVGGNDQGPDPYTYLLVALGTCTSMTLRLYAEQKKLPLQRVRVRLSHRKVHAQDCADCGTREGKVDEITRELTLEGDLDAAQRDRLLEIAGRCPVARTLTGEVKIRSKLAD